MTNTNTVEWGNIELPGLSDEELFEKNWNHLGAIRETLNKKEYWKAYWKAMLSPEWKKKQKEGCTLIWQDPAYVLKYYASRQSLKENPAYKEIMTRVNREKADKPEFAENVRNGIKEKWKDPEYLAKQKQASELRKKPCYHNDIMYPSLKEAAKAVGVTTGCLRDWINSGKNGWRR